MDKSGKFARSSKIGGPLGSRAPMRPARVVGGRRNTIKVFLVDDHPVVRAGVRAYLRKCSIAVVGEAADGGEALRKVKKLAPDVVVLDVALPSIDGGELARRLHRLVPATKLIAFSIHSSEEYVAKMAQCGVQGYVTKDQPAEELLEAIKDVYQGGLHFPAGMTVIPPATAPGRLRTGRAALR